MELEKIFIVLCKPSDPGNAGAVCRVMKNMGLSQLRLANSQIAQTKENTDKIQARAVHAFDIWEKARYFDTLADAVKDCSIVVGTTRRRGQYRKNVSMTPRALANWLSEEGFGARHQSVALVFGNERTGLVDGELELCNFASHIPASDGQPSLNLSHAVQIYAYELFLAASQTVGQNPPSAVKGEWQPMNQERISALIASITDTLEGLGFYKQYGRDIQERFLHDVVARAGLSEKEGKYFKDVFVKAARLGKG